MSDKNKFFEMLNSITEVAKIQDNHISREDIKKLFGDMELNESQYEHVYAYLAANNIKIDGYVEGNNEYRQAVLHEKETEIVEEIEQVQDTETEDSTIDDTTKHVEKDSTYLKMYLEDLSAIDDLREGEEEKLLNKIKVGDEQSKVRLIEGYLKLVVKIAKEYVNRGILIEDLIGEGNIGLMSGVNSITELIDCSNISTYLENKIRGALIEVLNEDSEQGNFEKKVMERASYLNSASNELAEDLGRTPTLKELSVYTKISEEDIKHILNMSGDSINVGIHHTHTENDKK
jgi:RNA polymerase primary sigma factor